MRCNKDLRDRVLRAASIPNVDAGVMIGATNKPRRMVHASPTAGPAASGTTISEE